MQVLGCTLAVWDSRRVRQEAKAHGGGLRKTGIAGLRSQGRLAGTSWEGSGESRVVTGRLQPAPTRNDKIEGVS